MSAHIETEPLIEHFYRMLRTASTDPDMRTMLFDLLKLPATQCQLLVQRLEPGTNDGNDLKMALALLQDKQIAQAVRRYLQT